MKKIIIVMSMALLILFSGCTGIERTYVHGTEKIVLSPDSTYHWYDLKTGDVWVGKYEETQDTILIILDSPLPSMPLQKSKTDTNLTYKSDVWELQ